MNEWNKLRPKNNPFLKHEFFQALRESGSIGVKSGWEPVTFNSDEALLFSFIKQHSYGEYIFDWDWASAYHSHGIPYYPKLTSMIPFTPVTTSHFLMPTFNAGIAGKLLAKHEDFYQQGDYSSAHFLFVTLDESELFKRFGYLARESMQYHFLNQGYSTFDDFLNALKGKKAKHIRQERELDGIQLKQYTGDELSDEKALRMYHFYLSTIDKKEGIDYLQESFFKLVFQTMKENIMYAEASVNDEVIAGALFFYDSETLYGRYWGSKIEINNLHFELCYYQGIDFCIKKCLKKFEAGAQGEHKITRGFRPVRTFSSHKLKHPAFHSAVGSFIREERTHIEIAIQQLSKRLPFKS